ncbi:(2Fe-2S)-binding protein [Bacillus sp. T33-2]|uniref:(2Fe-2S)-binding protein n=1 Tax=Bacillus sp. T33-2 TaxID=2054168 RepID=UPI0015E11B87|nr:(2Fe-2S)-binding protein [Bacillus sp. T33-2]
MNVKLTPQEANELARFRFSAQLPDERTTVNIGLLLRERNMAKFLSNIKSELQAPDLKVAASVFSKRFAFVAVIQLYAMTVWNKRLIFTLDTLELTHRKDQGQWLPEYSVGSLEAEPVADMDREKWRDAALEHLFKETILPVLDSLSKTAKISKLILWENIAVYMFWLYRTILADKDDSQIADDFDYIVNSAPGKLFGNYNSNPLKKFNSKEVYVEAHKEFVRIRKTCCFSYQLGEKQTYCKTCPRSCLPLMKEG